MTEPAAAPAGSRAGAPVAAPVVDEGGDPACWAHLFDAEVDDAEVDDAEVDDAEVDDAEVDGPSGEVAVDLRRVTDGGPGAVWSLPHGGDLDANLVRLAPHGEVGEHVNRDVDVLLAVQDGTGEVEVDGRPHRLHAGVVALVPRGTSRRITAGPTGLAYLSVHRRRSLTIRPGTPP